MEQNIYTNTIEHEAWHSLEIEKIIEELQTNRQGIDDSEANKRLHFYGKNTLPQSKKTSIWEIIGHQILNPLIFILIAAAIVSMVIGEFKDAVFILLVIIINSVLGTYQEFNAEKSVASLQSLLKIIARVIRNNKEQDIESEQLVPGDIVLLETGIKVPADIRILECNNLTIDESFLTGESIASKKNNNPMPKNVSIADRNNMAFAGSTVMSGRGLGVVVTTGIQTQVGNIARDVKESLSAKPPLVLRMEKFTKQISVFVVALSILLALLLRFYGMDFSAIFFFVVALAVSAIPEGLPIALTVALSIATKRMSKRNVIVRKLTAVESLGSCTIIASDKTGTLTLNEQTVKNIVLPDNTEFSASGQGYNGEGEIFQTNSNDKIVQYGNIKELDELFTISVLANEAQLVKEQNQWNRLGDAMDIALLGAIYKYGISPEALRSKYTLLDIIPYESEQKYSASFYKGENQNTYFGMKGAVETVLNYCKSMTYNGQVVDIDTSMILAQAEEKAAAGYRVLGIAGTDEPDFSKKQIYEDDDITSLTFYGLICFIDPLRENAIESVATCRKAGIKVIMITGDHPSTAKTISQQLGIADKQTTVVTGDMLSKAGPFDSPAFEKLVSSTTVFARVSPAQKLEIVDVLIKQGEFVAVTGDGVNDAPALKRANIGVAMGSGTDVAKEVGSMIVTDDNFSSIVSGVEEGRFAYDNVRKVIYLLISTGAAEVILFIASILAGLPLPLLAVQLLWLNLVTNGIQDVALAFEGGEQNTMQKKPRKTNEKIFNELMLKQTVVSGLVIGSIVFFVWYWLITILQMEEFQARNIILLLMVFMQNFHALNCRSETISSFKIPVSKNIVLIFGILLAQGIHILSMHIPFMQSILRVEPVSFYSWIQILVFAIPILIAMELFKFIRRSKEKNILY